ncbi:MAG: polysaccharide deacetylase family protein [Bacteroidia bacterium]|nr:polysaccharide deacetylase family protein [Bacteroidia bacterium]MBT8286656.1 polysaccharide deacetylase family protein [Bacteroidia bacterium]NNK72446.1 polysaccharide deacetylase family protein [Flavobacteriaceae bacterium]
MKYPFKPFFGGIGSILFMHKVVEDKTDEPRIELMKANEISVRFLEEMILSLKNQYDLISLDQVEARLKNPEAHQKKFIVFTFDDGYRDNLALAYPIFKKHQVPFTIYITNCFPNKTAKLWWYMLEDIILENPSLIINQSKATMKFKIKTFIEKERAFMSVRTLLIQKSLAERNEILFQLQEQYDKNLSDYIENETLSWDDIKELSHDELVTIGCHSMNHLALNTLSVEEIKKEVLQSKEQLEKNIGKPVIHFAYPYGTKHEVAEREINLFESMNWFNTATTSRLGNIQPGHHSALNHLPRIQILGDEQDLEILDLYLYGMIPAMKNGFKPVVKI